MDNSACRCKFGRLTKHHCDCETRLCEATFQGCHNKSKWVWCHNAGIRSFRAQVQVMLRYLKKDLVCILSFFGKSMTCYRIFQNLDSGISAVTSFVFANLKCSINFHELTTQSALKVKRDPAQTQPWGHVEDVGLCRCSWSVSKWVIVY